MGTSYVPNQSIYAAFGPQYSNAAALQVTYATSRSGLDYRFWFLRDTEFRGSGKC